MTGDGVTTGPNFTGDLGSVFACMALVGDRGCGFESQFAAVQAALQRGATPREVAFGGDPDNGGFVRPNARLAKLLWQPRRAARAARPRCQFPGTCDARRRFVRTSAARPIRGVAGRR